MIISGLIAKPSKPRICAAGCGAIHFTRVSNLGGFLRQGGYVSQHLSGLTVLYWQGLAANEISPTETPGRCPRVKRRTGHGVWARPSLWTLNLARLVLTQVKAAKGPHPGIPHHRKPRKALAIHFRRGVFSWSEGCTEWYWHFARPKQEVL